MAAEVTAGPTLSIGDLARETGLTAATLRVWETRHAFPQPLRLPSGHRRYSADDIAAVLAVRRRREAGVRLDVAIQQVLAEADPLPRPSLFARIAERHPAQPRQVLRKATVARLARAIEDEVVATAQHAHLFGSFQTAENYVASQARWAELTRLAASAHVFADFGEGAAASGRERHDARGPVRVHLPVSAPMRREWTVICDAPALPVALLAWEPPGQDAPGDRDRAFEVIWTVDPAVVRDAARCCAEVAARAGSARAAELVAGPLVGAPSTPGAAPLAVARLVLRILGELDRARDR